jgi:cytochrome c-type biogenesis protein CcmF
MLLTIQYTSEHLLPGILGKSFIFVALVAALLSFVFYLFAEIKQKSLWRKVGKTTYIIHFASLMVVGASLFYILFQHYYEYAYVWKHTASYLPPKYIISAFWAGQEGSFLLWVIIQATLGMILLFTAKSFENRVMTVLAAGQFTLGTMILGLKPFGIVLGQSPFLLLRQEAGFSNAEFFLNPNYLSQIVDGNGINPLLENYWMVTHPPLLFLGYSAAIIPFAFAIASLWKSDFQLWLKPAFPWIIFAVISLGGGILLGGAWAYESLTFGGFWAWDPVENASLIPWLIIVAAMHSVILNKKRNHSFGLSFILVVIGYFLVIYASYLTRSGVLGETSAHAFGNNGLSTQMVFIMMVTLAVSLFLYFKNFRNFPKNEQEEFLSREFWMYLGMIVLILSAMQVFVATSIPVFNKVFGLDIAPPDERVAFYNRWQLPFAVLVMLITSVSMILKYGRNDFKNFFTRFGLSLIIANVLFVMEIYLFKIQSFSILLFLLSINLALVSAVDYLLRNKFNQSSLSNALSHFGFALFLLGVLVAFSTSKVISTNTSRFDLGDEVSNRENQLLVKNNLKALNEYYVQYDSLQTETNHLYYRLNFYTKDKNGNLQKEFTVQPSINVNERMGNVYDPDTYHSFSKDVFTYITYADIMADATNNRYKTIFDDELKVGQRISLDSAWLELRNIRIEKQGANIDVNNISIIGEMVLLDKMDTSKFQTFDLSYDIRNGAISKSQYLIADKNLRFRFVNISNQSSGIKIAVDREDMNFIVVKSTIFPYISIMWIGVFITFIGLGISLYRQIKLSKK